MPLLNDKHKMLYKKTKFNLFANLPVLFVITAAVFLVYSNTLQSPFTFDDQQIVENYFFKNFDWSWEGIEKVATMSYNKRRMLVNISFALNYYFDGSNVLGYHLVNTIIHICVAFVFYLLARTTLSLAFNTKPLQRIGEIACMAALIWAIHPLQTNAVTYIVQRMTSMATLFFLLTLLCYVRGRIHEQVDLKKAALFGAAVLFGIMAMLSKEISGMLPMIIVGYEFFFLRQSKSITQNSKKNLLLYGGSLVIFIVICFIFLGSDPLARILNDFNHREFTLSQRLLTETRIIFLYLGLLILPLPSRLNLAYEYQLSTGLMAPPQTLLAIIGLTGLVWLIFYFYRRDRLFGFAIFWFLANLFIESSFIALELIFEHRMYMPSMFLILAFVAWGYRLLDKQLNFVRLILCTLAILLAFFTWQRNTVWQNEITLWTDVVQKSPGLVRGYVNLGNAYAKSGQLDEAEMFLVRAIELDPADGHSYESFGTILEKQQRFNEAINIYNEALTRKKVDIAKLHSNLSIVHFKVGNFRATIDHAQQSIKLNPYRINPHVTLGSAYFKTKSYQQSEDAFLKAIAIFPNKGDAYVGLGTVYEHQNKLIEAASVIEKALTLKEVNRSRAYNNLGIIYWRLGNLEKSANAAQKAIELDPELLDAYLTLGITYESMGQVDQAFGQFRKAWQKGLDMIPIYNDWALNFIRTNAPDKAILYLQEAIKLDPGRPTSHKNLSRAYQMKGMLQEAETHRQLSRQNENRQ